MLTQPTTQTPAATLQPPTSDDLRAALQRLFGFEAFRPGQEAVIRAVMSGRDTLALMPTGAGKSLCYQLPAMLLPGITLVISPLIALMKDQHEGLPPPIYEQSTFINSSLDSAELDRRMADVLAGKIKLVYAAPERLRQQPFVHALRRAGIGLLVIDEAHCVSLWGHDFRPDYLYIGRALAPLGEPRVLAMTATATPQVAHEISEQLGRPLHLVHTSPFRPNLFYQVRHLKHAKEKTRALIEFCRGQRGSGIIYVRSRRQAEELAHALRNGGIKAEHYHAGLESAERSAVQERWMFDQTRVITATIAFGMGIDKSNVRFIVHYSPPDSLESYAQESGRAGRDGRPAICLMLATPGDRANLTRWLREEQLDKERLRRIYGALKIQTPIPGRATLVNFADAERDANEGQARTLSDTDLRVGVGLMERAGLLVRLADAPASLTVRLEGGLFQAADPAFDQFVATAGLTSGGTVMDLYVAGLAHTLGWSPTELEARLLTWRDEGRLRFRPGAREPVVERLRAPADSGQRMDTLLNQYEAAQQARLSDLMEYAETQECRHAVIARHLGHTIPACGTGCDNCASGAAHLAIRETSASRAAQLDALLARVRTVKTSFAGTGLTVKTAVAIIGGVAEFPYPVSKTATAQVLVGYDTAPFKKDQVPSFGVLGQAYRKDTSRLIDALVDLGYLRADSSMGARVITLGRVEDVAPEPAPGTRPRGLFTVEGEEESPALAAARYEQASERIAAALEEEGTEPEIPANPAQIMLECIASLPYPLGKTNVARILAGADSAPIEADRCRHFGALGMCSQENIAAGLQTLLDAGWLRQMGTEKPVLARTAQAKDAQPAPGLVQLAYKAGVGPEARRKRLERERERLEAAHAAARLAEAHALDPVDEDLAQDRFERLRAWRRVTAEKAHVPPYIIFHDKTLRALAGARVLTLDDLKSIPGMGRASAEKYGPDLLAILEEGDGG
jgi:ATP-dependent DNA helicase RecQ